MGTIKVILVKSLQTNPFVTLPLPPVPPGESFINLSNSLIYSSAMIRAKIYQMAICFKGR